MSSSLSFPIAAVMIHVTDTDQALAWYQKAFPGAARCVQEGFIYLQYRGAMLECVLADGKVASGTAGSVVYWQVEGFEAALQHFLDIGATLYRGPMAIEAQQRMCQVRDPWGNCIGLRGPTE